MYLTRAFLLRICECKWKGRMSLTPSIVSTLMTLIYKSSDESTDKFAVSFYPFSSSRQHRNLYIKGLFFSLYELSSYSTMWSKLRGLS